MDKATTRSMAQKKGGDISNINTTVKEAVLPTEGNINEVILA